jgi:glycosyltransferase involved in cell wall biosynthesis
MKLSDKKIKICFLADKHDLFDDRIYWKMAVPLKEKGYDIYYLLIRGETKKGITKEGIKYEILKVKTFSKNRYLNFILKNLNPSNNYKLLLKKAKEINADVYHFHDLWINRIGKKLKKLKQLPVVFYDAREPYAEDYVSYTNAKGIFKKIIYLFSYFVDSWEKNKSKNYDLVISNEEIVRDKFRNNLGKEKVEVIYNFTNIYKNFNNIPLINKEYDFIYCGGVTELRGAFKILEATLIAKSKLPAIKVVFVGKYSPDNLKEKLQKFIDNNKLNDNVSLISEVDYSEVSNFYNKSKIGLVTLLPAKTFKISMPIKIFEYMAFALPIIGSNFGHIKKYIEKENCGIVVNPTEPEDISKAMITLLTDSEKYDLYSNNGRKTTLEKYKWDFEFNRLIGFYTKALNEREKNIKNVK